MGVTAGLAVSSVICYVQPRMYESSAVLAANEIPGRTVALAPVHAAQALRLVAGRNSVSPSAIGEVFSVCENTRIKASKGAVEIHVRRTNKVDARDLALELCPVQ